MIPMGAPAVQVRSVTKRFRPPPAPWRRLLRLPPEPDVVALEDVSLTLHAGEILGLVGPNGAGKTVLVKLIATLTEPTSGELSVLGMDPVRQARQIRRRIGLATADERSFYWRLSCRQNLMFFARLYGASGAAGRRLVDSLLETVDLDAAADRPYRVLSAGNRQRLAIARALLPDPPLLLLDEPTSSLDPVAAARLRKLVAERLHQDGRRSVLFTSHDPQEVEELSTRVAVLSGGRILACEDVHSLRKRSNNGRAEAVTILARSVAEETLTALAGTVQGLSWRRQEHEGCEIRFRRRAEDDLLDRVLGRLVAAGSRILDCRTTSADLRDALDHLLNGTKEGGHG